MKIMSYYDREAYDKLLKATAQLMTMLEAMDNEVDQIPNNMTCIFTLLRKAHADLTIARKMGEAESMT